MPNCNFYAAGSDFVAILTFIFAETGCRVFESYSPFDQELVEFHCPEEIAARYPIGACQADAPSVLLRLLAPGAGGKITFKRIKLKPSTGATFRYTAEGWGFIHLHLGGVSPKGLVPSNTNHNSEKRATAWHPTCPELGPVDGWNWVEITRTSNQINRYIRNKLAVAKIGTRAVLPDAQAQLADGLRPLSP